MRLVFGMCTCVTGFLSDEERHYRGDKRILRERGGPGLISTKYYVPNPLHNVLIVFR